MKRTIILGLGNTIRGDDGIGIYIAQRLKCWLKTENSDIITTQQAGWNWLDLLSGYQRAIIIDSIRTEKGRPGEVYRLGLADLRRRDTLFSLHHLGLATLWDWGEKLGVSLPQEVIIYALEVKHESAYAQGLSAELREAAFKVAGRICAELRLLLKEEDVLWQLCS